MYVLGAVLVLMVIYVAFRVERAESSTREIAKSVAELSGKATNVQRETQDSLGYEWYEDGWPFIEEEDGDETARFENPIPYASRDEYSDQLLLARYRAAIGHERLTFLRRVTTPNRSLPDALVEEVCRGNDVNVRVWLASHNWLNFPSKSQWEQSFEAILEGDPEPVVRAALFSNPYYSRLPWDWSGPNDGWQQLISIQEPIARLAMMRNPKLSDRLVVALMKESSASLGMTRAEQSLLVYTAARNPDLVGGSRLTGRDYFVVDGDPNSPSQEYAEMWRLAYDRWRDTLAAYQVFRYIQTTPAVKLELYNRCAGSEAGIDNEGFRATILGSCEPLKDGEILKLGWSDPSERCREVARKRIGHHAHWVGVT